MANIHGVAGEWARIRGSVFGLWPLYLGCAFTGFAVATCVYVSAGVGLIVLSAALIWFAVSIRIGFRRVERFYKGARGEERVSGILKTFSSGYHVFNDFVARGVHVDHVVAGPAGVYAIETKCWNGKVTVEDGCVLVDGRIPSREPLSQALREAALVKQELAGMGWTGTVTPILAFASDTFDAGIAEVQGVVVINAGGLRDAFDVKRSILAPAEVERLVQLMKR